MIKLTVDNTIDPLSPGAITWLEAAEKSINHSELLDMHREVIKQMSENLALYGEAHLSSNGRIVTKMYYDGNKVVVEHASPIEMCK